MLSKESKIRVLENFYALDYIFFGKPVANVESCCPLIKEEYISIKGAIMSVFVEMLKLVDHQPAVIDEQVDSNTLMANARAAAKTARENAQKIVTTDKSRATIKEALKEMLKEDKNLDISAAIEEKIRTKAFGYAVDNLLLARVVSEAKAFDKLNEWEGSIIEDSYKILRDNLIESAHDILYTEGEDVEDEDDAEDEKKVVDEDEDVILSGEERVAELHTEQFIQEFFEFAGFLNAIGSRLQASYEQCRTTKCHKSGGTVKSSLHLRGMSGCTDLCWAQAIDSAIKTATAGKGRCKTARNPAKCEARFETLIRRYQAASARYKAKAKTKLDKYKARLAKKGK